MVGYREYFLGEMSTGDKKILLMSRELKVENLIEMGTIYNEGWCDGYDGRWMNMYTRDTPEYEAYGDGFANGKRESERERDETS